MERVITQKQDLTFLQWSHVRNSSGTAGTLTEKSKDVLFEGLETALSKEHMEKIWQMIWTRWCHFENLCNS